jgi:hypothetical protein
MQLPLEEELTISQILRIYGKSFKQISERYSDGRDGRCAIGVIMSYHGWNGKDDFHASRKLSAASIALRRAGIDKNLLIGMNDSGMPFGEIADFLDRYNDILNSY